MNEVMEVVLRVIDEDYYRAEDYPSLEVDIDNYDMIYEEIGQYLELDNEDILRDMADSLIYSYVSKELLYGNEEIEVKNRIDGLDEVLEEYIAKCKRIM